MSRLQSMIRRLMAQEACLNAAIAEIADVPGVVLELGLGNGRTFDHLREAMPEREILVFERQLNAHPGCIPPDDQLILGDVTQTLPKLAGRLANRVAMIHADLGTADPLYPPALRRLCTNTFAGLLAPGGLVLCDKPIDVHGTVRRDLPDDVAPGRYFMFQRARTG